MKTNNIIPQIDFTDVVINQNIIDRLRDLQGDWSADTHLDTLRRTARRILQDAGDLSATTDDLRQDIALLQGLQHIEDLILALALREPDAIEATTIAAGLAAQ